MVDVEVFSDPGTLAQKAASRIAELVRGSESPRVSIGLAGGSTPAATYRELRGADLEWERIDLWLSDERWVPLDHPDSNGRTVAEILDGVPARFFRPRWAPWLEPAEAAAHYEAQLRSLHPSDHQPDLILLGMGVDGHTASLFPGTDALAVERRWFVANWIEPRNTWRLTATLPMIHRARQILFLIAGEGKAETMSRVVGGERLPATLVAEGSAAVTFLIDQAAASCLD